VDGVTYIEKFSSPEKLIHQLPDENLGIAVTIPSYREEKIKDAILSLINCDSPSCGVEVLVLINFPDNLEEPDKEFHRKQSKELKIWSKKFDNQNLKIHIIEKELPEKNAGVGLARKLLMDEVVRRFAILDKEGVIASYDADCTCDKNYLVALEIFFANNKSSPGCSIYFEHNLEESSIPSAILEYELYLRYYVQGLRYSTYPHAFHTVGSAMAVRTQSYRMQGGMNMRKAAEDFHFLHKIIPIPGFRNLTTTRVIPSARISNRVPFGTGKAMLNWESKNMRFWPACKAETFDLIKDFLEQSQSFYKEKITRNWIEKNISPMFHEFLWKENFIEEIELIKSNTKSANTFGKAFLRWFNGLRVLQLTHHLRYNHCGEVPVNEASLNLLKMMEREFSGDNRELLEYYRVLDKSN
jgi:hypothetical protein